MQQIAGVDAALFAEAAGFGEAAGAQGLTLHETLLGWAERATGPENFVVGAQVALGWVEGEAARRFSESVHDRATGLPTDAYLRLRLDEVYRRCRALAMSPAHAYALVVIRRSRIAGAPPFTPEEEHVVADLVRSHFLAETVAANGPGSVVVLMERTPTLFDEVVALDHLLEEAVGSSHRFRTWIETLPGDRAYVDSLLRDLRVLPPEMEAPLDAVGRPRLTLVPGEPDALLLDWYGGSGGVLGLSLAEWQVPAVDSLVEAVRDQREPGAALARLGAARRHQGFGVAEVLLDFGALLDALPPARRARLDTFDTVRALTTPWSHASGTDGLASCVDALTGLASPPYLRERVAEIDRRCERLGVRAEDAFALVHVALLGDQPDRFARLGDRIAVAERLRAAFEHGETIALAAKDRFVAVAALDATLPRQVERLRSLVAEQVPRAAVHVGPLHLDGS